MNKEEWIDTVMNSTQGMNRALPTDRLYTNIATGLHRPVAKIVPLQVKRWAAAAILLLALNIGSVVYYAGQNRKAASTNPAGEMAQEFETTYNY